MKDEGLLTQVLPLPFFGAALSAVGATGGGEDFKLKKKSNEKVNFLNFKSMNSQSFVLKNTSIQHTSENLTFRADGRQSKV